MHANNYGSPPTHSTRITAARLWRNGRNFRISGARPARSDCMPPARLQTPTRHPIRGPLHPTGLAKAPSGQPIRPQTNHALTQSFGSTHRVELLVRSHRVDPSSSLVSIQSKELRSSRKCARQRNASSLSGWYSMIVVGRQIGVSAMAYKMMTPVSCAIRCQKL